MRRTSKWAELQVSRGNKSIRRVMLSDGIREGTAERAFVEQKAQTLRRRQTKFGSKSCCLDLTLPVFYKMDKNWFIHRAWSRDTWDNV